MTAVPIGHKAACGRSHTPPSPTANPTPETCSGQVTPDGALLLASLIYIAVLCLACLLPSPALRCIIAASSAITVAYTPLLKRITAIKNAAVAFIIAASPLTGALAAAVRPLPAPNLLPHEHAPETCPGRTKLLFALLVSFAVQRSCRHC